jgi:hypothetical protein
MKTIHCPVQLSVPYLLPKQGRERRVFPFGEMSEHDTQDKSQDEKGNIKWMTYIGYARAYVM